MTKDLVLVKYGTFLGKSFVVVVVFPRKNFRVFFGFVPQMLFFYSGMEGQEIQHITEGLCQICLCIGDLSMHWPGYEGTKNRDYKVC